MPPKKIVTLCFSLVILAGVIYTIATNVMMVYERKGESEEWDGLQESYSEMSEQGVPVNAEESGALDSSRGYEQVGRKSETRTLSVEAPDFELRNLDGERVRLSDFKGKKVLINFWATWCPPCVKEMPAMQKFHDEHAAKEGVVILAVNATDKESSINAVKRFAREFGISFPILLDVNGDVLLNYEVLTLPTSLIIDEEGIVVEQILGPVTEEVLVEKLL
ncbi:peroxiredoxin family protein [Ureibacillus sinduriensis]|uniref:peroxiredoxin family protein n=1 Tax=Ureibacillus sinduriensis TaxID=561440 RepID=UPI00068B00D4|nr:TlpA disulfide reductase family protein [Ureibacillus sinduriensis]